MTWGRLSHNDPASAKGRRLRANRDEMGGGAAAVVGRNRCAAGPRANAAVHLPATLPSIAEKTKGIDKQDGFLPVHWDVPRARSGSRSRPLGKEILYYTSLPAGIGSNDIGLDRGQLGAAQSCASSGSAEGAPGPAQLRLSRDSGDPDERRAVRSRSRRRCSGASRSPPKPRAGCSSTRRRSSCATCTTSSAASSRRLPARRVAERREPRADARPSRATPRSTRS